MRRNCVHVPIEDNGYMKPFMEAFDRAYGPIAPVSCAMDKIGVQRYDDGENIFVHVLNYNYDAEADRIVNVPEISVKVKGAFGKALEVICMNGQKAPSYTLEADGDDVRVTLKDAGVYTVLAFSL